MTYEKYKDSELDWLGNIPDHWDKIRLKDFGYLQNGISKGKEYFGSGFPFVSYSNVYNETIELSSITTFAKSDLADQNLYSVKESDVFFTRTSETIDEIGIATTALKSIPTATFSGFVIRFRPNRKVLFKGYSKYLFRANFYRNYLCKEIALVTRASLNQNVLGSLTALVPPLSEQQAIAQYLDRKTKAIDKKVSLLEQKIDYYKELRKSLINDAVTKGLDKTVRLKDSGIEWVGKIPEHWKVKRLKDFFRLSKGKNSQVYSNVYVKDEKNLGEYPVYSGQTENDGLMGKINTYEYDFAEPVLLVTTVGAKAMKLKLVKDKFTLSQNCALIEGLKIHIVYSYYFLTSLFREERKVIPTIMQPSLRIEDLTQYIFVQPPVIEQEAIAAFLDQKTATIDKIVQNITDQIDRLKELRKTLINDVVTGKIRVYEPTENKVVA